MIRNCDGYFDIDFVNINENISVYLFSFIVLV